jgi:succinyl-CoA synthetase alpha subunit
MPADTMRDFPKPVVAMVVGRHAPVEKRMGHAGALVGSAREGAAAKLARSPRAGCRIAAAGAGGHNAHRARAEG